MSNKKIKELEGLSALTGGDTFVVVNSGVTKQVDFSALTNSITGITGSDTFVTGGTMSANTLTLTNNDGDSISIDINSFTGLTVSGSLSATDVSTPILSATTISGDTLISSSFSATTIDTPSLSADTITSPSVSSTTITSTTINVSVISATTIYGDGSGISNAGLFITGTGVGSAVLSGSNSIASGTSSVAIGTDNIAGGDQSFAEGYFTTATGPASHSEGLFTKALGVVAHAEGQSTLAYGSSSHAEGNGTTASGTSSHAEGSSSKAHGTASHAEGSSTLALADNSHAEGQSTIASGASSHAEGNATKADGPFSHAEGFNATAIGGASHAEGISTVAIGSQSHAEGSTTTALGTSSHAEGSITKALGDASHAEGSATTASGQSAHAEGFFTKALELGAHAEGHLTFANGIASHAEGSGTTAFAGYSHAGGRSSIASGETSFVHSKASNSGGVNSAILGGSGNTLTDAATGSVILGGENITGTSANTVYGINFDASGNILSGGTNLTSVFAPAGSDTNTYTTGVTFNSNLLTTSKSDNTSITTVIDNFTGLTVSGNISATTLNGGNILSGGTNLSDIFVTQGGTNFANVLFVDPNGDDGTAVVGNSTLPFLTLEAASSAATSGQTIHVMPGSYTATTTATNGLSKDGVDWYFYEGAIVNKATSGPIFGNLGLVNNSTVYGKGEFYGSGSCGYIFWNQRSSVDWTFEAKIVEHTSSRCFSDAYSTGQKCKIYVTDRIKSTSSNAVFFYGGYLYLECPIIQSTADDAIVRRSGTYTSIVANEILSVGAFNGFNGDIGPGNTSVVAGYVYKATLSGGYHSWNVPRIDYMVSSVVTLNVNGYVRYYTHSSGTAHIDLCGDITMNGGGELHTTVDNETLTATFSTTSKGYAYLKAPIKGVSYNNQPRAFTISGSGAIVNLVGDWSWYNTSFAISNGILRVLDRYHFAAITSGNFNFTLSGGKMELLGTLDASDVTSTAFRAPIDKTGGTLIINGGTIVVNNQIQKAICAPDTPQDVKIYAGGFNTNKVNVFGVEKQKIKQTGNSASQPQTLTINGVTFTATPDTLANMAQDLATQINASVDVNISGVVTASQDTPGTDTYFYVEADVAGVEFLVTSVGYASVEYIPFHTEVITDLIGGTIIEDSDIE